MSRSTRTPQLPARVQRRVAGRPRRGERSDYAGDVAEALAGIETRIRSSELTFSITLDRTGDTLLTAWSLTLFVAKLETYRAAAIAEARVVDGEPWSAIGEAVGVSAQAARQRWAKQCEIYAEQFS